MFIKEIGGDIFLISPSLIDMVRRFEKNAKVGSMPSIVSGIVYLKPNGSGLKSLNLDEENLSRVERELVEYMYSTRKLSKI